MNMVSRIAFVAVSQTLHITAKLKINDQPWLPLYDVLIAWHKSPMATVQPEHWETVTLFTTSSIVCQPDKLHLKTLMWLHSKITLYSTCHVKTEPKMPSHPKKQLIQCLITTNPHSQPKQHLLELYFTDHAGMDYLLDEDTEFL